MRALTLALLLFGLFAACGGGKYVPDCRGGVYCRWDLEEGPKELCCPTDYPYCGAPRTDCPPGKCCNAQPREVQ